MAKFVNVSVDFDSEYLTKSIIENITDDETMLKIHELLYEYVEPYVPMESGSMLDGTLIEPDGVTYPGPYAHYMYEGVVYGPNKRIPVVTPSGEIIYAFNSPAGVSKSPTGKLLNYNPRVVYPSLAEALNGVPPYPHPNKHPLATHHWDDAMMIDKGDEFTESVKKVLVERLDKHGG